MNTKSNPVVSSLVCIILIFAGNSFAQDHSYWVGESNSMGFSTLIEIHDMDSDSVRISVFGPAPLHYEFPLFSGEVEFSNAKNRVYFTFRIRGQAVNFDGKIESGRLIGQLVLSDDKDSVAEDIEFVRALIPAQPENFSGIYGSDGEANVFVTAREFGGLRAIDLNTSENHSLINVGGGQFVTWGKLRAFAADVRQAPELQFENDQLTWRLDAGEAKTLTIMDGLLQQSVQVDGSAGILTGTLILPDGNGPHPGVVLVHGSGPIYRTVLIEQAVAFARMGVAALIYDKRGTGTSAGNKWDASFDELARDLLDVHDWLQTHPSIDAGRTGLQGLSQAGYVIPIAVAADPSINFAMITNGGSVKPWQQSLYDKANDFDREGFSQAVKDRGLSLMRKMFDFILVRSDEGRAELEAELHAAQSESWFDITDLPRLEKIPSWQDPPPPMLEYYEELSFDPLDAQARMRIPVLVQLGDKDLTMPADVVAAGWDETARIAGNDRITIRKIAGANHGMRLENPDGKTGGLRPDYLLMQRRWLEEQGVVPAAELNFNLIRPLLSIPTLHVAASRHR